MEKKIMEFSVISTDNRFKLKDQINNHIKEGYQLYGTMIVTPFIDRGMQQFLYTQSMVKYEKK